MIKIYCLVDPRNNAPFYVGATKVLLKTRLSGHIHDASVFKTNKYAQKYTAYQKHYLIIDLINCNIKPRIDLLHTCNIHSAEFYEYFFYQMLIKQGFNILNFKQHLNYKKYLQ